MASLKTQEKNPSESLAHILQRLAFEKTTSLSSSSSSSSSHRLILVQHNNTSIALRKQACTTVQHPELYRNSQLETPVEVAARQWQQSHPHVWFDYMIEQIRKSKKRIGNNKIEEKEKQNREAPQIYWWSTTSSSSMSSHCRDPNTNTHWLPEDVHRVNSVSTHSNPFPWYSSKETNEKEQQQQQEEEEESTHVSSPIPPQQPTCSIINLNSCLDYFKNMAKTITTTNATTTAEDITGTKWIFVESIQPLCMFHGFDATWQCLQQLLQSSYIVVIPVPTTEGLLSPTHHRILEDAAWAVLCLQEDPIVLLRRGLRESSNLLRQTINYRLDSTHSSKSSNQTTTTTQSIRIVEIQGEEGMEPTTNNTTTSSTSTTTQTNSSGKIQLQFESDDNNMDKNNTKTSNKTSSSSNRPRIFLQDNDPELEDYDEEDPDDDLDI